MSLSNVALSPQTTMLKETASEKPGPAPAGRGNRVLGILRSWMKAGGQHSAQGGPKNARLRHEIELRAQLAVGEAKAYSLCLYEALRHEVEMRAQLAVAEANAVAELRIIALRQAVEHQAELAAAAAQARAEQRIVTLRQEIGHRAGVAAAEAQVRTKQRILALRHEIEQRAQLAVAEAHARADQRLEALADRQAASLRQEIEARAQFVSGEARAYADARMDGGRNSRHPLTATTIWSPPLTWRVVGSPDIVAMRLPADREIARALAELGHGVARAPSEPAEVTALVASHSPPINAGAGPIILVGHDWEEGGYPLDWIDNINAAFAGIGCASRHTRKILIDHGVAIPVATIGLGIDHWDRIPPDPDYRAPGKGFRFLHISACDPASGLDLLIESFARVFDDDDDVSLIIKPSGAVPGEILTLLSQLRRARRFPEIIVIEDELSEAELKALYGRCDVFLAPGRAAGFAMPVAQALLCGVPVVTTAWGGHLDYCDDTSAWLVDYQFERAGIRHDLVASVWAAPLATALDEALWMAYRAEPAERFAKAWTGRKQLIEHFTWKDTALRMALLANDRRGVETTRTSAGRRERAGQHSAAIVNLFDRSLGHSVQPRLFQCRRIH